MEVEAEGAKLGELGWLGGLATRCWGIAEDEEAADGPAEEGKVDPSGAIFWMVT
jgi:hypothetical protein